MLRRLIILLLIVGCEPKDCAGVAGGDAVELWGQCYNIEETTWLDLRSSGLTGESPS